MSSTSSVPSTFISAVAAFIGPARSLPLGNMNRYSIPIIGQESVKMDIDLDPARFIQKKDGWRTNGGN